MTNSHPNDFLIGRTIVFYDDFGKIFNSKKIHKVDNEKVYYWNDLGKAHSELAKLLESGAIKII